MLCKIFLYSICGDAFSWFSQLQPGSLTCWEDIERAFPYKFLDDAEATREKEKNDKWDMLVESWQIKRENQIPRQFLDYIMVEGDEQHVSGELTRVEESGTEDSILTSIDSTTSPSTDGTTSTSNDGTTSTSIDGTTSTSTDGTTSTSTDGTTSTSTDGTTSTSTDGTTSTSSCPHHIADSTHKSNDVSEKLEDWDSSREVTMEDFLELEEWLEDMYQNSKKKLDDDQHTSRGDLETSPKASIDRHQPDEIDRQPPHIIDQRPPYIIDLQSADSINLHPHSIINRHPLDCMDRHPWLAELP
uniref:Retrotransposon gag domain-containing protein n=1 Tax=Brassica oleracea TaxID=3712 RepID=A0A3P6EC47_BRAOL|nr:unnamed protein product [Brassica oleracea]